MQGRTGYAVAYTEGTGRANPPNSTLPLISPVKASSVAPSLLIVFAIVVWLFAYGWTATTRSALPLSLQNRIYVTPVIYMSLRPENRSCSSFEMWIMLHPQLGR